MAEKRIHIRNVADVNTKRVDNEDVELIVDAVGEKNGECYQTIIHLDISFLPYFVYAIMDYYNEVRKNIEEEVQNMKTAIEGDQ